MTVQSIYWMRKQVKNIRIFNSDPQKIFDSNYISFYKGVPVIKVPFMGTDMASFGVIFMGPDADQRRNAIEDVKHEYGHSVHFSQIGIVNYTATVAIPSLIGYFTVSTENYYSQPWEYIAEILGGVNNRMYDEKPYPYSSYAALNGKIYWGYTVFLP